MEQVDERMMATLFLRSRILSRGDLGWLTLGSESLRRMCRLLRRDVAVAAWIVKVCTWVLKFSRKMKFGHMVKRLCEKCRRMARSSMARMLAFSCSRIILRPRVVGRFGDGSGTRRSGRL